MTTYRACRRNSRHPTKLYWTLGPAIYCLCGVFTYNKGSDQLSSVSLTLCRN